MPNTLEAFLVNATQKAADDLVVALERLPDDKRAWSPMGDARSALDMIAECAILNGTTAEMIAARAFPAFDWDSYRSAKSALAEDPAGGGLWRCCARTLPERLRRFPGLMVRISG